MRKKLLALVLALAVTAGLLPAAALAAGNELACAATQEVEVDGQRIEFQMYALKDADGGLTNYVKLRDVAYVLKGTPAEFSIRWSGTAIALTSGEPYTETGTEMTTPYSGDRSYRRGEWHLVVNGTTVQMDAIVLSDDQGGDYTYFKLRDLGTALGFSVGWSAERGVFLETGILREDQSDLLLFLLLYERYQGSLGQSKRTPLQQLQGIWYGRDDGRGAAEEIQIKDSQFLSTTCSGGVYENISATISEVTGSNGNFRMVLRNGTTVTVNAAGRTSTSKWESDLRWINYSLVGQSVGGSTVSRLNRASSLELYPQFLTVWADAGR